ncbi:small ribosomal subunit protein mS35 isoform X2 [Narcine bancroftii]|uniref:small ribosomal subunit protein mS35 isoform X2 n=1 Tax=Narcine bancroftii TaxID=1343680 RepID=UPI003831A37A
MAAGRAAGRGLVALTIVRRPIPPFRGIAFHSTTLSFTSPLPAKASINEPRTTLKEKQRREPTPPRNEKMGVDQNWCNVYPTAASFKPSVVPLPIRMGYPVKRGMPPDKTGNLELIKIPNFLHLTPPAIKNHCAALKDFCTVWPAALDNDEKCEEHFPIEITTTDYVAAGPSVRNPNARVVTLTIKILNLNLDDHAKKKLIKLVGNRYNKNTDILTITTDRCPLRQQNYDYALYLLTVLYHESWLQSCSGEGLTFTLEDSIFNLKKSQTPEWIEWRECLSAGVLQTAASHHHTMKLTFQVHF